MTENGKQPEQALPKRWEWVSVGEIAKDISPGFPCGEHNTMGKGIPHIRPMNISPKGEIDLSLVKYVESSEYDSLRKGDVLFNNTNSPTWLGKTTFIRRDSDWAYSNHMTRIRLPSEINSGWIAYALHYLFQTGFFRMNCRHHVNQASINTTFLSENVFVPFPPLPEQHRIVDVIETQFTRLDAAVKALEQAQIKLKRYRASVLQAACECRLVPTEAELAQKEGRDYEPADQLLERILVERRAKWEEERWEYEVERAKKKAAQAERKAAGLPYYIRELEPEHWQDRAPEEYEKYLPKSDKWKDRYDEPQPPDTEDLSDLPEGWVWASMEQVSNILGGLTKNSKRKQYSKRLRVANVYANELRLDDVKQIGVKNSELNRVLLERSDLLIVEGNGSIDQIGRVAVWNSSIEPCVHQNHLIKARLIFPEIAKYVLYWLLSLGGREHIVKVASSTSGLYTLSLSKVSRLPLPMPPLLEQHRIVSEVERRLSVVDALEKTVSANLTRAERTRQAILKKAFEGRLVEQRPEDGDARELLERIGTERQGGK